MKAINKVLYGFELPDLNAKTFVDIIQSNEDLLKHMLGDATEEPCDRELRGNSGLSQSALFKQLYDAVAQYNIGLADNKKGQQTGLPDVELLVRSHLHDMCPKVSLPTCPVELKIEYDDKEEEVPEQKINKEQVETMVKKMIHDRVK